jgi:prophage regulatory protein
MMSENNVAFWRWRELKKRVPFGRTTIWAMCKEGRFPKPYRIGKLAIAWRSDEVQAWIEARERS